VTNILNRFLNVGRAAGLMITGYPKIEYCITQLNGYIESLNPIYRAAINKNSI
jgi:hypothetical protein